MPEDILIETLETFGFPVRLQGSLSEEENYPNDFFTFWNNDSSGESFYDNEEKSTSFDYDVNFYSTNPEKVYRILREAKQKLLEKNFIISGDGHSVASDELTHTGRGMNILFLRRT